MVEIMEYLLVFAVTASLAGFSVLVFESYLPALDQSQTSADFNQLNGAAGTASVDGSASLVLPLDNASVACSSGVISFSSNGLNYSSSVNYPCDFAYTGLSGSCKMLFSREVDGLALQVTC